MKVLPINIRGLGGGRKWKYLRELLNTEKPSAMCVHETKLQNIVESKYYNL